MSIAKREVEPFLAAIGRALSVGNVDRVAAAWRQLLAGGGKGGLDRSFYVISRREGALGIDLAGSRDDR